MEKYKQKEDLEAFFPKNANSAQRAGLSFFEAKRNKNMNALNNDENLEKNKKIRRMIFNNTGQ